MRVLLLRRRAAYLALSLAAAAGLMIAACGSTGPSGTAAPPRTAEPVATTAAPATSAPASAPPSVAPSATPGVAFNPKGLKVEFDEVAAGLEQPLAVANAGDRTGRLFIAEQGGRIRIVRDGTLLDKPFLDIADRITSGGERGLLGVAFHPNFPKDPRVFVDYTDEDGDTRVSSFTVDPASPDRVDASTERRLVFVKQPYANHNGGAVVFGPDGYLYIAMGDGGSGGDPQGNGQSLKTLLGKILRIDVDHPTGDRGYVIPPDNPYADGADGSQPEIWLTGLRNPWRMSFDRGTGDLWIGDVGQGAWEEIDVQRAGVPGGTNFGWNRMEGSHCYRPTSGCTDPSLTLPVTDYGHKEGCTVIGGNVDRGTDEPALSGGYLFADYCSGRVWAIDPSSNAFREPTQVATTDHNFAAFGEDERGELYAVDISGGSLLRVTGSRG